MRGLTFLLANLLPSVSSLSLSLPLSFSLSPPYLFCETTRRTISSLHRRSTYTHDPSRNVSFLCSYISSFGGLRATREAFSRATFPLRAEGLLDFFPSTIGGGEQIVVTLIVTRTLLCDKIPAFYFHPTIKDPRRRLRAWNFRFFPLLREGTTTPLRTAYISRWNIVRWCTRIPRKCEQIRLSSTISSYRVRQFNDLPGTGLQAQFSCFIIGRLNTVSNSRSVADI